MYQPLLIIAISLGLKIIGIYWHVIGIEDLTKAEGGSAPSAPSRRAPRVGAHPGCCGKSTSFGYGKRWKINEHHLHLYIYRISDIH